MAWYGAHIIMTVRFKDGKQDSFPAWENVHLIEAKDPKEAEAKAASIGRESEGDSSGTFHWSDRPARWEFAGIRRIIEIANEKSSAGGPTDGAEITYQTVEFETEESLLDYAAGRPAILKVID
jgi:hypothetical protein